MELREGYKNTDVGVIPEDWVVKNILDNFTLKARIGWQGLTTAEYLETGDFGLVTGTDFKNGYIDWDNCVYVEKSRYVQDKNIQLRINDVLVTKDGTIGKVAFIDKLPNPTTLNSGVFVIRPKNENIDNQFFYYLLMSFYFDNFLSKITAGSTITHLYQKDFSTFNFIVPTKAEQTAIATALSDADALINSLSTLIAKKRNIKQGAMQQLLQPKEGWEVKKLGDFLDYEQPTEYLVTDTEYNDNNQIPVLTAGKTFILGYTNEEYGIFKKLPVIIFDDFTTAIKYVDFPFKAKSSAMKMLLPKNEKVNLRFIYEIMLQIKYQVADHKRHWIGEYSKIEIKVPSTPEEQNEIATILSDMDAEIQALETKLEKYRKIKLGMMQNLLTGKIRLV